MSIKSQLWSLRSQNDYCQGIAPTILIARVALTNTETDRNTVPPPTIPHISALKFGSAGGGENGSESRGEVTGPASMIVMQASDVESEKKASVDTVGEIGKENMV